MTLSDLIAAALKEDIGSGDVTSESLIDEKTKATGRFVSREDGVVSGIACVREVFRQIGSGDTAPGVEEQTADGKRIRAGETLVTVTGSARGILAGERVALNFLCHLSGIATLTRQFVDAVAGTSAAILDTRKTTPGLRELEKHAVVMGGGQNHRKGLSDHVLIKDNHLVAFGATGKNRAAGLTKAIHGARKEFSGLIEVEVDSPEEVRIAADAGADIILLDNFDEEQTRYAVQFVDKKFKNKPDRPLLESSGGVRLETVRKLAETCVDRISIGALTHSARALDIGLDFEVSD